MFRWLRGGAGGSKEGGSMRMYMKFRQEMFQKNFEPLAQKSSPVRLWDLSRHDDALDVANIDTSANKDGSWRISDDGVIGGYSRGKVHMIRTSQDYQRFMKGEPLQDVYQNLHQEEDGEEEDGEDGEEGEEGEEGEDTSTSTLTNSTLNNDINFTPFLRWQGNIDTTVGLQSDAQRSGFCAIRATEYPYGGANLQGLYNALEIVCRTDGRLYTVNLAVSSFFPGDMYQGYINIPPTHPDQTKICPETGGHMERLVLPFTKFALTAQGRMRDYQRTLDSNVEVQHIGFTIMDGKDGKFQFDLARIRAVNFDGRRILGDDETEDTLDDTPVKIAR